MKSTNFKCDVTPQVVRTGPPVPVTVIVRIVVQVTQLKPTTFLF